MASVAGFIVDTSEAAVPGAHVAIRNLSTGMERTSESNNLGYYVLPALPVGPHSLTIGKEGFQIRTVPKLILEVDQNASLNISLKVGVVSETVNVTAEASDIESATRLEAGSQLISASGGRGNSTTFVLDGGLHEDPFGSGQRRSQSRCDSGIQF